MFNFGSEAIYSCITGFEIVQGSASRICQASGSWNGTQPSCERKLICSAAKSMDLFFNKNVFLHIEYEFNEICIQ